MKSFKGKSIAAFLFLLSTNIFAGTDGVNILTPDNLNWQPMPNHPELQYVVMSGNPMQKGYFTVRLKFPKDYTDVVHSHAAARYDTVISGSYYLGVGDQVDKSKAEKIVAGSFTTCPANVKHFGFTEEETVVQIAGMGPWEALKSGGKKR